MSSGAITGVFGLPCHSLVSARRVPSLEASASGRRARPQGRVATAAAGVTFTAAAAAAAPVFRVPALTPQLMFGLFCLILSVISGLKCAESRARSLLLQQLRLNGCRVIPAASAEPGLKEKCRL